LSVKRPHGQVDASFAAAVVQWQAVHGRNDLPWQNTRDPYRVWLSEIMLQQTQVATVRAYFARFTEQLPTVQALANASLDEVLGLWSGLGYYSRARNLHACAQWVMRDFGGAFPRTAEQLATLPGIGRSTAAAIASLCFGEPVAILDANVRRVLTRVNGFGEDLAQAANERALWTLAQSVVPHGPTAKDSMPRYTQGMMDLGATLCLTKNPQCNTCPVERFCVAAKQGNPQDYPVRSRRIKRSSQAIWLLWAHTAQGAVWLAPRPTPGVWAGLQCLPLFESEEAMHSAVPERMRMRLEALPVFTHVLTHKDLHLHTWRVQLPDSAKLPLKGRWFAGDEWRSAGLPAPVRKLLQNA
jgi:A/G-specific adenine glycosylase